MGLALGIVLECDLIVAAAGTKFQVTETSRGLGGAYPSLAPLFKPITEFVPDSPLEGDGFEPSVPRQFLAVPSIPAQFTFRDIAGSLAPGTQGLMVRIHLLPSRESCANLGVDHAQPVDPQGLGSASRKPVEGTASCIMGLIDQIIRHPPVPR
jgi:hypothetical protein